jgi:hypothetical protein
VDVILDPACQPVPVCWRVRTTRAGPHDAAPGTGAARLHAGLAFDILEYLVRRREPAWALPSERGTILVAPSGVVARAEVHR